MMKSPDDLLMNFYSENVQIKPNAAKSKILVAMEFIQMLKEIVPAHSGKRRIYAGRAGKIN